jgi:hypothetical protein
MRLRYVVMVTACNPSAAHQWMGAGNSLRDEAFRSPILNAPEGLGRRESYQQARQVNQNVQSIE